MKKNLFVFIFLLFIKSLDINAQTISVSWPNDHAVFQHVAGTSATTVYFAGQVLGMCSTSGTLTYKIDQLNESGTFVSNIQSFQTITMGSYGTFYTTKSLGRGWYKASFSHTNGATASVVFGVGDVYVIAGQSNASGFDSGFTEVMPTRTEYDCVVCINKAQPCSKPLTMESISTAFSKISNSNSTSPIFKITPSGDFAWTWGVLGNEIANYYKPLNSNNTVPVSFFNAAAAGTSSNNWKQGADGVATKLLDFNTGLETANYVCGSLSGTQYQSTGQPYLGFKNTLQYYGSIYGVKAVLWHQGEYDNLQNPEPSGTTYSNNINGIITQSRTDFPQGIASQNLQWLIAKKATHYNSTTSLTIQTTQASLASAQNSGPDTDQLGNTFRIDNTHLYQNGLDSTGKMWRTELKNIKSGSTKVIDYIKGFAASPLNAFTSLSNSSGSYTVQVASGFSQYIWVKGSNPMYINENAISTTNSYTNNFFNFQSSGIRCYMVSSNGKISISPMFYPPTPCGARMSSSIYPEIEEVQLSNYPNPFEFSTTLVLKLPKAGVGTLEILNEQGERIALIAEGAFDKGEFKYPLQKGILVKGTYYARIKIDDIFVTRRIAILE